MKHKALILFIFLRSALGLFAQEPGYYLSYINPRIQDIALLMSEEKYTEAKKLLEKLLEKEPNNDMAWYYMSECYWEAQDYKSALLAMEKACDLDPNNHHYLERFYYGLSAFDQLQAIRDSVASELVKKYPKRYKTSNSLTLLAEKEIKEHKDSLAYIHLQEALNLNPSNHRAAFSLAVLARFKGNMATYFNSLPIYLYTDEVAVENKVDFLYEEINSLDRNSYLLHKDRYTELANILIEKYPTDTLALGFAGDWAYIVGDKNKADSYYIKICDTAPSSLMGWYKRLYILESFEEKEKLILEAEKHIKDDEDLSFLYLSYADLLMAEKHEKQALKIYRQALALNPKDYTICNNYAYALSKIYPKNKKKLKEALSYSAKTLGADEPGISAYLDTYAWILHLLGEDEKARVYYKKCMTCGGRDSKEVLMNYSIVLRALNDDFLADYYKQLAESK